MKIAKMAKIVYRQIPTPQELPQQIPTLGQKLGCKSPRVGQLFGANPRAEIDGHIRAITFVFLILLYEFPFLFCQAGYVIKTVNMEDNMKIFINMCSSDQVEEATVKDEIREG